MENKITTNLVREYEELLEKYKDVVRALCILLKSLGGRYEIDLWDWPENIVGENPYLVRKIDLLTGKLILEYRENNGNDADQHHPTS